MDALILGIVEGITEFLPISSTGHLIVASHLLGRDSEGDKIFDVVIQLGAVLAVACQYREKLLAYSRAPRSKATRHFVLNIALAFTPAACLGLAFHGIIKQHLFSPVVVAIALVIGGVVILFVERGDRQPRHLFEAVEDVSPKTALAIGFAQSLALIPGVSRSAATIIGGVLLGLNRRLAVEFSFMLALPTIFAASVYDLYKGWHLLESSLVIDILIGFVASFFCALVAIRALLHLITHHNFTVFGWYRIVFGMGIGAALWLGWM